MVPLEVHASGHFTAIWAHTKWYYLRNNSDVPSELVQANASGVYSIDYYSPHGFSHPEQHVDQRRFSCSRPSYNAYL